MRTALSHSSPDELENPSMFMAKCLLCKWRVFSSRKKISNAAWDIGWGVDKLAGIF
jgi:hypothetical protein